MPQRYVARHARPRPKKKARPLLAATCSVAVLALLGATLPGTVDADYIATTDHFPTPRCVDPQADDPVTGTPVDVWVKTSSWLGADQGSSVATSEGSVLWLFNDTLTSRPGQTSMVRNSISVTRGPCLIYSSLDDHESLADFFPASPGTWWWPTHGVQGSNAGVAWVAAGRYTGGTGTWDFRHVGDALFEIDFTGAQPKVARSVAAPETITPLTWSAGLVQWEGKLVLYGVDSEHNMFAAATPLDDPGSSWSFAGENGTWTDRWSEAAPLARLRATSVSFFEHEGAWVGAVKPDGFMGRDVTALVGQTPLGPFETVKWFTAPALGDGRWTYNPVVHRSSTGKNSVSVSLSTNDESWESTVADPRLYRPLFLEVSAPSTAGLTSLPTRP